MLSKEEIEKAKKFLKGVAESQKDLEDCKTTELYKNENKSINTLLQYIKELEISNAELDKENNRLEKIEFERDEANSKIKELKDKMESDRMEQFDDYVIYLIDSYLEIVGGEKQ